VKVDRANFVLFFSFKMDAIKKKMQAMKLEKDNAMDRADACEQQAKDANLRAERVSKDSPLLIPLSLNCSKA